MRTKRADDSFACGNSSSIFIEIFSSVLSPVHRIPSLGFHPSFLDVSHSVATIDYVYFCWQLLVVFASETHSLSFQSHLLVSLSVATTDLTDVTCGTATHCEMVPSFGSNKCCVPRIKGTITMDVV